MRTTGLSLEQAPHLSVPASFFLTVPVSMLAAGSILIFAGATPFTSPWHQQAIALTHVGTIGILLMGMIGALYQMTPVVAGTPVPMLRLAHAVHALLLIGLACFAWRLLGGPVAAMSLASYCIGLALLAFLVPVGWSLANSATRNEIVFGMRLGALALAAAAILGLAVAQGYAGKGFGESRFLLTQLHLTLALLGWVGALLMSVSWQIVPMFYLAPSMGTTTMRSLLALLIVGLLLPFTTYAFDDGGKTILALASLAAALAIWLVHPLLTLLGIAKRKRRRYDASILFWRVGLLSALLLIPLASCGFLSGDHRLLFLFGWFAIWGWAGMIMHGMLTRIVPFIVWFHRFAPRIGKSRVPSIRSLTSQRHITIGFALHLASLVTGTAAIYTVSDMLARTTGLLVAAVGISLGSSLVRVLRYPGDGKAPEENS